MSEKLECYDCPAPYGEDGWVDVNIADEYWDKICPDGGGVLCFRCMTKRLEAAGLTNVPVLISAGPYRDANETWRMHGIRHGQRIQREEDNTLLKKLQSEKQQLLDQREIGRANWIAAANASGDLLVRIVRELVAARRENICDVCFGQPLASGRTCMCGGTGKMSDAARWLREQLCISVGPTDGTSLLRPNEKLTTCYCKPGRCMAPVVMGRQTTCLDPDKAGCGYV